MDGGEDRLAQPPYEGGGDVDIALLDCIHGYLCLYVFVSEWVCDSILLGSRD